MLPDELQRGNGGVDILRRGGGEPDCGLKHVFLDPSPRQICHADTELSVDVFFLSGDFEPFEGFVVIALNALSVHIAHDELKLRLSVVQRLFLQLFVSVVSSNLLFSGRGDGARYFAGRRRSIGAPNPAR